MNTNNVSKKKDKVVQLQKDYSVYFRVQEGAVKSSNGGEFEIFSLLSRNSYSVSNSHIA